MLEKLKIEKEEIEEKYNRLFLEFNNQKLAFSNLSVLIKRK